MPPFIVHDDDDDDDDDGAITMVTVMSCKKERISLVSQSNLASFVPITSGAPRRPLGGSEVGLCLLCRPLSSGLDWTSQR